MATGAVSGTDPCRQLSIRGGDRSRPGKYAYVPDGDPDRPRRNTARGVIPHSGRALLHAQHRRHGVSVITAATGRGDGHPSRWATFVRCSRDHSTGKYAYVPNNGDGTVSVITTATGVSAPSSNGKSPGSVTFTPDGSTLLKGIISEAEDQASVINTATGVVSASITVGNHPGRFTIKCHAYVINILDDTVSRSPRRRVRCRPPRSASIHEASRITRRQARLRSLDDTPWPFITCG